MATVAAQARDFARCFFQVVGELGHDRWVPAGHAFERTLATHADHPYVAYLQANRARKAGFSAAAERVREAEFPQIERRKAGTRRNAPVFYRARSSDPPGPCRLSLDLPYQVPPSHPLRSRAETPTGNALRRPPDRPSRSPWRRRLAARRPHPDASSGGTLALWWQELAGSALDLLATISRAVGRRLS